MQIDYYTVRVQDGAPSSVVENLLADIEGTTSRVLTDLDKGIFPDGLAREQACLFLALQQGRGPDQRDAMTEAATQIGKLIALSIPEDQLRAQLVETLGREPSPEEISTERTLNSKLAKGLTVQIPREHHVAAMLETAKVVLPYLTARPWMLMRFDEPVLLTADLPVALHAPPEHNSWAGVGLANAALVGFPIDPKQLLVLGPPGEQQCDKKVFEAESASTARELNEQLAFQAYQWIFHHPKTTPLVGLNVPARPPMVSGPFSKR